MYIHKLELFEILLLTAIVLVHFIHVTLGKYIV